MLWDKKTHINGVALIQNDPIIRFSRKITQLYEDHHKKTFSLDHKYDKKTSSDNSYVIICPNGSDYKSPKFS